MSLKSLKSECYATNSAVTCHVTNLSDETVVACMQGVITQKESAGVRLYSMPICTGALAPLNTRPAEGTWDGGHAKDICKNARGYLSWDECNFSVIEFDPKKK